MNRNVGLAALAVALATGAVHAQDNRLQVHGYLTQAYGAADSGAYLGVPQDGTADYRIAALQVRYALTSDDHFVMQLSHRRLGESPMTVNEPDVAMDWVYYSRHFGDFNARIGRVPIPAGIYNEVRDVGVLLPLYRAPFNVYFEGAFTSETVDGAVLRYDVLPGSPWNAEVYAFGGTWKMTQRGYGPDGYVPAEVRIKNGLGAQLWVTTPFEDVRVGGGASRQDAGEAQFGGIWKEWHVSFDGTTRWVTLQGEYRKLVLNVLNWEGYYASVGIHPVGGLTIHGQADFGDLLWKAVPLGVPPVPVDFDRTKSVGASYAFRPDVVVKGEYHFTKGYWPDTPVLDPTAGDPPSQVNYFLLSLSVSF
jgi:hypothetical protein